MPALLSHYRPDAQIYAFTESAAVQRRLALYHGVTALRMPFGDDADETFDRCRPWGFPCPPTGKPCPLIGRHAAAGHCHGRRGERKG